MRILSLRAIITVVAFVVIVYLGDRGLGYLLERLCVASQMRYSQLYRGGMENDVVILGNSRGVNTFYAPGITEALKRPCINLSHNGMAVVVLEALLDDYLAKNRAPELLIVEITSLSQEPENCVEALRPYYGLSEGLSRLAAEYDPTNLAGTKVSHLYRYNSELFLRALYYLARSDQKWIARRTILPELVERTRREPAVEFSSPRPENLESLQRIVEKAEARGITIRLVVGPYLPAYIEPAHGFDGMLASVRREVSDDVPIWDYSRAIMDQECFADRIHLNARGAEILLSRMVAEDLFNASANRAVSASLAGSAGVGSEQSVGGCRNHFASAGGSRIANGDVGK